MPIPLPAREWGRQQAAQSPPWPDEKWQRVATLLGIRLTDDDQDDDPHDVELVS